MTFLVIKVMLKQFIWIISVIAKWRIAICKLTVSTGILINNYPKTGISSE